MADKHITLDNLTTYDSNIKTYISEKLDNLNLKQVATTGSYDSLINIPNTFTPSSHTHTASEITDISNISINYSNLIGRPNDLGDFANAAGYAKTEDIVTTVNTAIDNALADTTSDIAQSIVVNNNIMTTISGYKTSIDAAVKSINNDKTTIESEIATAKADLKNDYTIYYVNLDSKLDDMDTYEHKVTKAKDETVKARNEVVSAKEEIDNYYQGIFTMQIAPPINSLDSSTVLATPTIGMI